jgi:hypothetical protein
MVLVMGEQNERRRVCASPTSRSMRVCARRDLPMPGSPDTSTTEPSPLFACCQRRSSIASSSSRPTSGVAVAQSASNRLSARLSRNTCAATTGAAKPLIATAPRCS